MALGGAIPSGAALATSDETTACSNVFSDEQGALAIEAPRYVASMAIADNGDGTFRVPYHLVLWRTLGATYTADRAYDCVFVDATGTPSPSRTRDFSASSSTRPSSPRRQAVRCVTS